MDRRRARLAGALLCATFLLPGAAARADIVVSSNDGHTLLDDQGNQVAPPQPAADTVSILDIGQTPPRVTATIPVPGSVVGPPMAVWVAPDESWAIVTSATKADPQGQFGISPDNRVSVLDLSASPPRVVQQLTAGDGATAVRVSPDGALALIANRTAGTVSVYAVRDKRLSPAGTIDFGKQSGPSGIVFLHDNRTALVSRNFDHQVSVLHFDGTSVTVDKRPITTGLGSYTMDINRAGTLVAVSNMGRGAGDVDSVSLIDVTTTPFRTVETVAVPSGPEPLKFSPDGQFLAVGAENGSNLARNAPFFHDHGLMTLFAVEGQHLRQVAQAQAGRWLEGIAFSRDGRTILLQSMYDRTVSVFGWADGKLTPRDTMTFEEGPEAFGTAW